MDHMLRLLRSKCAYCGLLRLRRAEVNRVACKLKLIQYGLLQESEDLENIHLRDKSADPIAVDGENDESEEEDEESLIKRRIAFVKHALKNAKRKNITAGMEAQKFEVVAEQRRAVVDGFLRAASVSKTCGSCKG